jgi:thymidine phosphorylase
LLELHADDASRFDRALAVLDGGIEIGASYDAPPLILDRISAI